MTFRQWRDSLELSQSEAARALGISVRTVKRYEADKWPVPYTTRLAMAAVKAGLEGV